MRSNRLKIFMMAAEGLIFRLRSSEGRTGFSLRRSEEEPSSFV